MQLSCTPQLTPTQSLPTFKTHCKKHANQRSSLQLKPPKILRKNNAELQPQPPLNPNRAQPPRPKKRTKRKRFNVDTFNCNVSALAEAIQRTFRHPPPPSLGAGLEACQILLPISADSKASDGPRPTRRPSLKIAAWPPFADPRTPNVGFLADFLPIENSSKIKPLKNVPKSQKSDP